MFKKFWRDFLYLNRSQKISSFLLVLCLLIILTMTALLKYYPVITKNSDYSSIIKTIDSLNAIEYSSTDSMKMIAHPIFKQLNDSTGIPPKRITININQIDSNTRIHHIPTYFTKRIIKYRDIY